MKKQASLITTKRFTPTSPGVRHQVSINAKRLLTKKRPEKNLTEFIKNKAGRSRGKITVRHRGGGHKKLYRIVDFKREQRGVSGEVTAIEYDPNRNAFIALITFDSGEKTYILWPKGLQVGDSVIASESVPVQPGNAAPLKNIPIGTTIHNIELTPGKGGQIVRSAGMGAVLMAKDRGFAQLRMPSGEIRLVPEKSWATIGEVGNSEYSLKKWGKAGRRRNKGWRPSVRGTAMSAHDHPHGGGEGRSGAGGPTKTLWGKPAHGKKTRQPNKYSDRMILSSRKKKRRK